MQRMMKIALFHNPKAGNGMLTASKLTRQFENAGYDVLYASIKERDCAGWRRTIRKLNANSLLDDETITGGILLLEVANMAFVGPI